MFQEFASAREATFLYGKEWITRDVMSATLIVFSLHFYKLDLFSYTKNLRHWWIDIELNRDMVESILRYRHSMTSHRALTTLLNRSRKCAASDKRDHIYAFLGLANECYGLKADYSDYNTVEVVFTELTRRIIESDCTLYILAQVKPPLSENVFQDSITSTVLENVFKDSPLGYRSGHLIVGRPT